MLYKRWIAKPLTHEALVLTPPSAEPTVLGDYVAPLVGRDELIFDRSQWAELRANTPLDLGPDDLAALQGINERLDMAEVVDVYLPLSRLLSLHAIASAEREVVADTFLGVLPAPRVAGAQSRKIFRIGVLSPYSASTPAPSFHAFREGFRELGYVEGQNIAFEYRSAEEKYERLPELAADLVSARQDCSG